MSTTTSVTMNCDFKAKQGAATKVCGKPDEVETVQFGVATERFELDLCAGHREQVNAQLASLQAMSRPVVSKNGQRNTSRQDAAEIRVWARKNGFTQLPDRGRIPTEIMEKYDAAKAAEQGADGVPAS